MVHLAPGSRPGQHTCSYNPLCIRWNHLTSLVGFLLWVRIVVLNMTQRHSVPGIHCPSHFVCWILTTVNSKQPHAFHASLLVAHCSLSAGSIIFLVKVMQWMLVYSVHVFLIWFVGLSRSIWWWTIRAEMPLREHSIHSFVQNAETEAQMKKWIWPSLPHELVLRLSLLQHMGSLLPLRSSFA